MNVSQGWLDCYGGDRHISLGWLMLTMIEQEICLECLTRRQGAPWQTAKTI